MEEDFFWGDYCLGVAIGNTLTENTYVWATLDDYSTEKDNSIYSIIDTGSTALMISSVYYESLITKMMAAVPDVTSWSFQDGIVFTPCEGTYPSLYFMFRQPLAPG